ncbi:hypothetical protein ACFLVX_05670, partial [Chloroflexota bacterium]
MDHLQSNEHFQLRLVKELRGSERQIITYPFLGKSREGGKYDKTLDFFSTDRAALQQARNYCRRGDERKGLLPGQFRGIVLTKFESKSRSFLVSRSLPNVQSADKPRKLGTTRWLYYLEPDKCKVFYVITN